MNEFENSSVIRLNFLRICLRDKELGESECVSSIFSLLLQITFLDINQANLKISAKSLYMDLLYFKKFLKISVMLEADKCLVNLLFNSSNGRANFKFFNKILNIFFYF
jgi:hypothetical protein